MKYLPLLFLLFIGHTYAQAAPVIKNLVSDNFPNTGTQPVSCNLYLATVFVVNTPVVGTTTKSCLFPNITLQPGQSFTATGVSAVGFESVQSVPFVLPAASGAPTGLRAAP